MSAIILSTSDFIPGKEIVGFPLLIYLIFRRMQIKQDETFEEREN